MDPVTPWIAALAERSLSFYLGRRDDGIQVEDIEGCLNFSFCDIPEKSAIIVTVRYLIGMNKAGNVTKICNSGVRETQVAMLLSQTLRTK